MDRLFKEIKDAIEEELNQQNPQRRRSGPTGGPGVPVEWEEVQGPPGPPSDQQEAPYQDEVARAAAYEEERARAAEERHRKRQEASRSGGSTQRRQERSMASPSASLHQQVTSMVKTRRGARRAFLLKEILDRPVSMRSTSGWSSPE